MGGAAIRGAAIREASLLGRIYGVSRKTLLGLAPVRQLKELPFMMASLPVPRWVTYQLALAPYPVRPAPMYPFRSYPEKS